ncbi:MAG: BlaI/MecI/CopY family transcriptional regulator [Dysgonamonadaceae bacterium]|jgi:predicted transcriptional regulator|nr:BlaI/MecI/CopY family transcriptional regulator [Dysgonamonadaceae bacterium]
MEKLTIQEEEAMRIVWKKEFGFIKDFLEDYPEPKLPYTTLASIVKNLEKKRYVSSRKYGNVYEYTPIIKEEEYKKTFMSGFVRNYFKNSYKDLVVFFVNEKALTSEELRELAEMIEQKNDKS